MPRLFERVTIAGVGLIGGSLALAARSAGLIGEVVGLGRSAANLRHRTATRHHRPLQPRPARRRPRRRLAAAGGAGAQHRRRSRTPARRRLRAGAVVSDVGSVKAAVRARGRGGVAGRASPSSARIRSPAPKSRAPQRRAPICSAAAAASSRRDAAATPAAVAKIRALWEGVGMRVDEMEAARHDRDPRLGEPPAARRRLQRRQRAARRRRGRGSSLPGRALATSRASPPARSRCGATSSWPTPTHVDAAIARFIAVLEAAARRDRTARRGRAECAAGAGARRRAASGPRRTE